MQWSAQAETARLGRRAIALLAAAAVCAFGQSTSGKARKAMKLELGLHAPAKPFIAQEPMVVFSFMKNAGTERVQVPLSSEPPPFDYIVYDEQDNVLQVGSRRKKATARTTRPGPRMLPFLEACEPGAAAMYRDDLNNVLLQPLGAGRYKLGLFYVHEGVSLRSRVVPIEVLPPRRGAFVQEMNGPGHDLWTARTVAGEAGLDLQKWQFREPAEDCSFARLGSFPEDTPIGDAAMAIEPPDGPPAGERWLVWANGETLHGGLLRVADFRFPLVPAAVGLESPRLLAPGFQDEETRGIFAVLGTREGRPALRLAVLTPDEEVRWVGATLPPRAEESLQVGMRWTEAGMELRLYWVEGGRRLVSNAVNPLTGEETQPPVLLHEVEGDLLAWRAAPNADAPVAAQLVTSRPSGTRLLALHAEGRVEETVLPALPAATLAIGPQWILPPQRGAAPVVAVVIGETAGWTTGGAAWQRLVARGLQEGTLRLWTAGSGRTFATYRDSEAGHIVRYP